MVKLKKKRIYLDWRSFHINTTFTLLGWTLGDIIQGIQGSSIRICIGALVMGFILSFFLHYGDK